MNTPQWSYLGCQPGGLLAFWASKCLVGGTLGHSGHQKRTADGFAWKTKWGEYGQRSVKPGHRTLAETVGKPANSMPTHR
jgi:hypothetical protein